MNETIATEHYALLESVAGLEKLAEIRVGHEDLGSFVKGISSFFTNKIPAIASAFVSNIARSEKIDKTKYNQFIREIIDQDKILRNILNDVKYMDVENIKCPIMVGSKLSLLETCAMLKQANVLITTEFQAALDYADLFISTLISSDDFRRSNSPTALNFNGQMVDGYKHSRSARELEDLIDKMIDAKAHADQKPLKELIPNISSLDTIKQQLLNIAENNTIDVIEKLNARVSTLAEKTNTLYEMLKNDKEIEISKNVAYEIPRVLENTAANVTSVCTIWHIINQTATTYKLMIERLDTYLKTHKK